MTGPTPTSGSRETVRNLVGGLAETGWPPGHANPEAEERINR
jgi:hypothetical protein